MCVQDPLPKLPESGKAAAAAAISQYACQRRTTTNNHNAVFTVRSSCLTSSSSWWDSNRCDPHARALICPLLTQKCREYISLQMSSISSCSVSDTCMTPARRVTPTRPGSVQPSQDGCWTRWSEPAGMDPSFCHLVRSAGGGSWTLYTHTHTPLGVLGPMVPLYHWSTYAHKNNKIALFLALSL